MDTKSVKNSNQIIHMDGMCNECGNCETFCPYESAPYKDKFTLYWNKSDFEEGKNAGFIKLDSDLNLFKVRLGNQVIEITFNLKGECEGDIPKDLADLIWEVNKNYGYLFI